MRFRRDHLFALVCLAPVVWALAGAFVGTSAFPCLAEEATSTGDSPEEQLLRAESSFRDRDWKTASKHYRAYLEIHPRNGRVQGRLGMSLLRLAEYSEAARAFETAVELGDSPPTHSYNVACALALAKKPVQAMKWLEKAVAAGFSNARLAEQDADLAILREDSQFKKLVSRMRKLGVQGGSSGSGGQGNPHSFLPEQRHFDFWLGEWDVVSKEGAKVGTNSITRVEGGAALLERWRSERGGTGTSFSYFDREEKKWHQVWVTPDGQTSDAVGGFDGESMLLASYRAGVVLGRTTWTPLEEGKVLQHWEKTEDGGATWTTAFYGIYVPRHNHESSGSRR